MAMAIVVKVTTMDGDLCYQKDTYIQFYSSLCPEGDINGCFILFYSNNKRRTNTLYPAYPHMHKP